MKTDVTQPHSLQAERAKMRTIRLGKRRTTVRLEPVFWDALEAVARRENLTTNDLCLKVYEKIDGESLTPALRVFLTAYAWSLSLPVALDAATTATIPAPLAAAGFGSEGP